MGVDPLKGDAEDWSALYAKALWLERWRNRNLAELIASMFGDGKKK